MERDIADEDDQDVLSLASTPPRISDEEASYSSYRTGEPSYQASKEDSKGDEQDDHLVGSEAYCQICDEVQQNLILEEQAVSMDVEPNPEPSAEDVARRQQEEEEAARRQAPDGTSPARGTSQGGRGSRDCPFDSD